MVRGLQAFKQTLKKEFINLLWGLLAALLVGIIFYFSVTVGLKKLFDQLGTCPHSLRRDGGNRQSPMPSK